MGAYHQMGHDSWNLVGEADLLNYKGLILSPVNDPPEQVKQRLSKIENNTRKGFEVIFDPQFYEPRSERGHLNSWAYFSSDVDTVNLTDLDWWEKRSEILTSVALDIGADAVCSPAILPRVYDANYYNWTVQCANTTARYATQAGLSVLLTAIVRLPELAKEGRPQEIGSILTATNVSRVYLVLSDDIAPRSQRTDVEGLAGAIKLIRLLEDAGTQVLVAFSGLDMLLWKAAGANSVATGKFFNLRRFVPGRFEDDAPEGGRVVPYWTDSNLVTWLREDDVRLLGKKEIIDFVAAMANPYSKKILDILNAGSGEPWVGLGWRQYLHWFQTTEAAISRDLSYAKNVLKGADSLWGRVGDSGVYLYDRQNTGEWVRPWLNALQVGLSN